ncbi:MAG TPA: DUF1064 domain-containing protein [Anaerolineae bacterium]|nr:DUF1064 domain-containing protein [Anaerolineae bacterium]
MARRRNKHGAVKVKEDGYTFDSKLEHRRYVGLKLVEASGQISQLAVHPRFLLQAAYTARDGEKVLKIEYEGDFSYYENGERICEDVKGHPTDIFKVKWKWVRKLYPEIDFRLVPAKDV